MSGGPPICIGNSNMAPVLLLILLITGVVLADSAALDDKETEGILHIIIIIICGSHSTASPSNISAIFFWFFHPCKTLK